jgi:hypothetical protein
MPSRPNVSGTFVARCANHETVDESRRPDSNRGPLHYESENRGPVGLICRRFGTVRAVGRGRISRVGTPFGTRAETKPGFIG